VDNEAGLASGWFDVDLSATGERQARDLGERYAGHDLAKVFCSDLRRTSRTAHLAFERRPSLPIIRDSRLRECDYGELTRRPAKEIESLRVRHIVCPFPGGESYEQVVGRVGSWLEELFSADDAGPVLVIGHRATFYALEHLLSGVPLREVMEAVWRWQPGWRYRVRD
jgi:broad specificity phosphatase PhoE